MAGQEDENEDEGDVEEEAERRGRRVRPLLCLPVSGPEGHMHAASAKGTDLSLPLSVHLSPPTGGSPSRKQPWSGPLGPAQRAAPWAVCDSTGEEAAAADCMAKMQALASLTGLLVCADGGPTAAGVAGGEMPPALGRVTDAGEHARP